MLSLGPPHSHLQRTSVGDYSCAFRCPLPQLEACLSVSLILPNVLYKVLASLMSLLYIFPHHGDLAKENVHHISWAARKSCNCSLLCSFQTQFAVVLDMAVLLNIIRWGLVLRVINVFSFLWNSIAVWDLVTSRCTAHGTAQVNISMYALPSSFLFILYMRGPAKSTPVC